MNTQLSEALSGVVIETADDLLADLDMSPNTDSSNDVSDAEILSALSSSDENAVEIAIEKAEAYAEQVVTGTGVEAVEGAAPAGKTKKERKARTTTSPAAVRAPKELTSIEASVFVLNSTTPSDLEANKASVIATRPDQKKIGEKFDNLFQAIAAGKKPSVYVMACFDVLDTKGTATSGDLVAALRATASRKGSDYNEGTARSQAGQIMVLFDTVGIASRTGQTLVKNDASKIGERLRALAAA